MGRGDVMATYGLWYFKAQDGNYETFPSPGTPSQLKGRGFTYAIALHSAAKDGNGNLLYGNIPFSGYSYNDGYQNGASLGRWIDSMLKGIDYLVVVPVLIDESNRGVRGIQYWKGWVDGVYDNTSGYQVGFYWYLENPWQVSGGVVYEEDIQEISNYIKNKGQQFIWIPYVHDKVNLENTDIKSIANYFTFVFVQPHYYQRWKEYYTGTLEGTPNEYPYLTRGVDALIEILNWIWSIPNGYIEMEVDGTINSYPELIKRHVSMLQHKRIRWLEIFGHREHTTTMLI